MITSPQALLFSNTDIRSSADKLSQLYYTAKDILARWNANGQNLVALFPNDIAEVVEDSASAIIAPATTVDGRPPITGAHVWNIISRLNEFVADMEANGNAKLNTVTAVAVNTTRK